MNEVIGKYLVVLNNISQGFCEYAISMFLQSSLLIIVLLVIDFVLRKRVRAVVRYCVWMLVFVKLVLPPTLCLPTGVGYWFGDLLTAKQSISQPISNMSVAEPAAEPVTHQVSGISTEFPPAQRPRSLTEAPAPATTAVSTLPAITWQMVVFLTWLAGVLTFSVLLIQRMLFVRGLIAQSEPANNRLLDVLEQCCRQIHLRRNVKLKLSNSIQSPAVCGLARPIILMPATLAEKLSPDKLKAVLIHELVHIKRGDLLVNLSQTILQIIYFYNPFVWLTNAVVRRIREQAVDEMVLVALGAEAKGYSNTLIDIAEMAFWKTNFSLRLIGVAESKKSLESRIGHMLARPIPKSAKIGVFGLLAIIVMAGVLLPMAKGTAVIGLGDSEYGILLLDNSDPNYSGKDQYDDRLYLLDSEGKVKGVFSGFNICETMGAAHMLAVDERRKTLWVAENVGARLWHFDLRTGKLLQRVIDVKASALAVDPGTGDVWVMMSGGKIGEGHIKVVSPSGRIKAEYEIPGFDIAYNSYDKSFWVIGKDIYKVDREGKILGQITGQILFTANSVSIDQKTGNAWVVVRAHLQVPDSKPELWAIDRDVQIRQRIDLGELIPFCVSVDSDKEIVWVGCLSTILRFTTRGDKLKSARQIPGFSVVPEPSTGSVFAASRLGVEKASVRESGYVEMGDMSERIVDQLGSSQKWLAVVPFADAKLQSSPALTHLTMRKTAKELIEAHPESDEKLRALGMALLMYANDYEDKFPDSLHRLEAYLKDENLKWLLENVEYLGKGKSTADPPNTLIAYDRTLLEKRDGTTVLYMDSHVEFLRTEQLEKLGIKPGQKTDVQVEIGKETAEAVKSMILLGMEVADVTLDIQKRYELYHTYGVVILNPGYSYERLGIGKLAEGYYFWMVGNKKIHNLREMITEILRINARSQPKEGGSVGEGYEGFIRIVYGYGKGRGTNTQYLQPTKADIKELRQAGKALGIPDDKLYYGKDKEMEARIESAEKLSDFGKALLIYANDHDDKYPVNMEDVKSYLRDKRDLDWLVENIEYVGKDESIITPPTAVLAYDETLLKKENCEGTNVLYNDAHVSFEKVEKLKELGIISKQKPAGQLEVESKARNQLSSGGGYQNLSREQRERLERRRANRQSLSYKNMQKLGLAIAVFANDHKGRCPSNLLDLHKYIGDEQTFDWINQNVLYLGKNQEYGDPPDAVLAYDESMLKKPRQETNVLYNDAHVSFEKSEWLEEQGIISEQKPAVQVEVEKPTVKVEGEEGSAATDTVEANDQRDKEVHETLNALFRQLHAIYKEKKILAEKRWNEMNREQQGRYIVSMSFQEALIIAKNMSKEKAEAAFDRARAEMTEKQWHEIVASLNHLNNNDRRFFKEKENQLADKIAALGKDAIPLLIAKMTFTSDNNMGRLEAKLAQAALTKIGNVAVAQLMFAAKDGNVGAVYVLGWLRAKKATLLLIECLRDKNPSMRVAAAVALTEIGDSRAMGPLVVALRDESYDVRWQAVKGLAKFGDSSCIAALEELARTATERGKIDIRPRIQEVIEEIKNRQKAEKTNVKIEVEKPDVQVEGEKR